MAKRNSRLDMVLKRAARAYNELNPELMTSFPKMINQSIVNNIDGSTGIRLGVRATGVKMPIAKDLKVQFGSGPRACPGWLNFDCSPTLRLQKLPIIGRFAQRKMSTVFEAEVRYGDTRIGLPLAHSSVKFLYCSHVLEHLSLEDFRLALKDSYRILEPGGIFRAVMPDLERVIEDYKSDNTPDACSRMMEASHLGTSRRPRGAMDIARALWGNSRHLWLWDYKGVKAELESAGFENVRRAEFGDSAYIAFSEIEEKNRWEKQLGFECRKPVHGADNSCSCEN